MRGVLKALGVLLVVCGLVLIFVANEGQEATKPYKVSLGVMYGEGNFQQIDSGHIGGNQEGYEEMGSLKNFGKFSMVAGVVVFLLSFTIKETKWD